MTTKNEKPTNMDYIVDLFYKNKVTALEALAFICVHLTFLPEIVEYKRKLTVNGTKFEVLIRKTK